MYVIEKIRYLLLLQKLENTIFRREQIVFILKTDLWNVKVTSLVWMGKWYVLGCYEDTEACYKI